MLLKLHCYRRCFALKLGELFNEEYCRIAIRKSAVLTVKHLQIAFDEKKEKKKQKRIRLKRNGEWRCFVSVYCMYANVRFAQLTTFPFIKHKMQLIQIAIGECQRWKSL